MTDDIKRVTGLSGRRVLIVEDEVTIAMLLEDMLEDFECQVVGPAGRVAAALALIQDQAIDVAILDVNLGGEAIYPVADALVRNNIPFVFSTGYGAGGINDAYRLRPVLPKPFAQDDLKRALEAALLGPPVE